LDQLAKNGVIQIIDNDVHDGYYQINFSNEEDYKHALFEGPWIVADHVLVVQRWKIEQEGDHMQGCQNRDFT